MADESEGLLGLTRPWGTLLRYGSYALMLVAIAYLVATLTRIEFREALADLGPAGAASIAATGVCYVGLLALLAQAWTIIATGNCRVPWSLSIRVYGMGVIAKYVPGAVLQYASRHVLGAREGWSHESMLRATLVEAALHIVCAALAGGALVAFGGAGGGLLAVALGAALVLFARQPLVRAAGLQLCFFTGFALCVYWLAADVLSLSSAPQIAGAFMIAWIVSFVVPVAPGGIGIRESTFLLLAGSLSPSAELALLAILARATTTLGDAGFGLLAYGVSLRSRWNRQASV